MYKTARYGANLIKAQNVFEHKCPYEAHIMHLERMLFFKALLLTASGKQSHINST